MFSIGTPESDSSETKLCRISRGVQSSAVSVVLATTARKERRALAQSWQREPGGTKHPIWNVSLVNSLMIQKNTRKRRMIGERPGGASTQQRDSISASATVQFPS